MRKILMAAALLLAAGRAQAAVDTLKLPIDAVSVSSAVTVSTQAWTNVSFPALRLTDQSELLIGNPSTNTSTMHGVLGDCATAPTVSTSTIKGPIEVAKAVSQTIEVSENVCLWMVSRNNPSAGENIMVQAVRRRR